MKKRLTIEAPAKINLLLNVLGKRADGYHELESIMHQVDLCDRVTLEACPQGVTLTSSSSEIPLGEDNLAYKAVMLIQQLYGLETGVKIGIEKNIPVGAGLAGGSTDAAAVLAGVNHMYDLQLTGAELMNLAAEIGSDVAFCLSGTYFEPSSGSLMSHGATALARGRGEIISPLPAQFIPFILIVKPPYELSTAQVYNELELNQAVSTAHAGNFLRLWANNDIITISKYMANDLETVSIKKRPEIKEIKKRMIEMGALIALMSGSGPSVFAIFQEEREAKLALREFKKYYSQVYLVSSYRRGD